ncbi:MAG: hypothetical protein ACYTG4_03230 [Planctomycetota bacterium]|jgi:tetratricopeptide (TPR) repeat protein
MTLADPAVILAVLFVATAVGGCCSAAPAEESPEPPQETPLPEIAGLWSFSDPGATRERFQEVLKNFSHRASDDYVAEVKTQIARTYSLSDGFDEAHAILDELEASGAVAGRDRVRLRYLLERGRTLRSAGSPDTARPLFIEAWELGQEIEEHPLAVDAAHMVALVEDPEGALKWNEIAIAYCEAPGHESAEKWLGSLYNNTGWTYDDRGDYEKALATFEKGLAWRRGKGATEAQVLPARQAVAHAKRRLGHFQEALKELQVIHEAWENPGTMEAYVLEDIAECLVGLGREDEARPLFTKCADILEADGWHRNNEPDRIAALRRKGSDSAE